MIETELTLELRPYHAGGMYTQISLRVTMETVVDPAEMRCLLQILSRWSGGPVDIALCVDGTNAGSCWLELWDDVMAHIRGRRLYQLRFPIKLHGAVDVDDGVDQ